MKISKLFWIIFFIILLCLTIIGLVKIVIQDREINILVSHKISLEEQLSLAESAKTNYTFVRRTRMIWLKYNPDITLEDWTKTIESIQLYCYKYKIDRELVVSLIVVESTCYPKARNFYSKAKGYGQFLDSTAKELMWKHYKTRKFNIYDAEINIRLICRYLRDLLNKYDNNIHLALAHYGGYRKKPGKSREQYINNILTLDF